MRRFVAAFDLHWGYERRGGHKVALHDHKAINCLLAFIEDFKPHIFVLGGDALDCSVVSHHNHGKPGRTEGLKLLSDAEELRANVLIPIEKLVSGRKIYHIGNHEDWLQDFLDVNPGLEGVISIEKLLGLGSKWEVIPQGKGSSLGKLYFVHGDQIQGGDYSAKAAVIASEKNIRFGHYHTSQEYTKTSFLDVKQAKTGKAIPCLCTKDPKYGEGKPNKWVQGFLFGYLLEDGTFHDYTAVIINGKTIVGGKVYAG